MLPPPSLSLQLPYHLYCPIQALLLTMDISTCLEVSKTLSLIAIEPVGLQITPKKAIFTLPLPLYL